MKMKTLRLAIAAVLMTSITQAQVSEKELLKKTEETIAKIHEEKPNGWEKKVFLPF